MEKKKYEKIIISIILIIQTIIFIIVGANKSYIHMDEAYSLGLASYDKVEIQDNENFYNIWHDGKYYEDYLCVNDDEIGQYKQVYENQKNDVHPPLYYLILRFAMGFHKNSYSKWPGIIINMIIYAFVTIFVYLIIGIIFLIIGSFIYFAFIDNPRLNPVFSLKHFEYVLNTFYMS